MKRPAVEEFKKLSVPENGPWGMADSDTVDLCDWILMLEARADKAKQLIEDIAPQSAIGALNGDYDKDI